MRRTLQLYLKSHVSFLERNSASNTIPMQFQAWVHHFHTIQNNKSKMYLVLDYSANKNICFQL